MGWLLLLNFAVSETAISIRWAKSLPWEYAVLELRSTSNFYVGRAWVYYVLCFWWSWPYFTRSVHWCGQLVLCSLDPIMGLVNKLVLSKTPGLLQQQHHFGTFVLSSVDRKHFLHQIEQLCHACISIANVKSTPWCLLRRLFCAFLILTATVRKRRFPSAESDPAGDEVKVQCLSTE